MFWRDEDTRHTAARCVEDSRAQLSAHWHSEAEVRRQIAASEAALERSRRVLARPEPWPFMRGPIRGAP